MNDLLQWFLYGPSLTITAPGWVWLLVIALLFYKIFFSQRNAK